MSILDKIEKSILKDKVWLPAEINKQGQLRFAEQVTVENKGAPKGKGIFLSRKKPSDFEEQDVGTYKHNEERHTKQLDKDWHSGRPTEIVANTEQVVYMRKLGSWTPRYKVDSNQRHFLKSLRRAQRVIEANNEGHRTAVNSPQSNKTGLHRVGGSS